MDKYRRSGVGVQEGAYWGYYEVLDCKITTLEMGYHRILTRLSLLGCGKQVFCSLNIAGLHVERYNTFVLLSMKVDGEPQWCFI